MGIKYEDYLNEGTHRLLEFLSLAETDKEERDAVVSIFIDEIVNNINTPDNLCDYEVIINNASITYIKKNVWAAINDNNVSHQECDKAIKLCERAEQILIRYTENQWKIPALNGIDFSKCKEILKKRQESISKSVKIVQGDKKVEELIKNANLELSVSACDMAFRALQKLFEDISSCRQEGIVVPTIINKDYKKTSKVIENLRQMAEQKEILYEEILNVDRQLHSLLAKTQTSPAQWQMVIDLCQKQTSLLNECSKKQWPLPTVRYSNPSIEANRYENYLKKEKLKGDKEKRVKRDRRLAILALVAVAVLGLFGIKKYREGKIQIPFDDVYVEGKDVNSIFEELSNVGFVNILKEEDASGWLKDNEVIRVSVDNREKFRKGTYVKPDVKVVITYSSIDRIYITDLLHDWKASDYENIEKRLIEAGFTNVDIEEMDTSDKKSDKIVAAITLNGMKYTNEHCYMPQNAPITITYYTLKIGLGSENRELIGQNYETVVNNLKERGFTNVQAEEIHIGWGKGNTVINVIVDNTNTYDGSESFPPDVKILVKYSSNDRLDATAIFEKWNTRNYEEVLEELKNKGFGNVTTKEKITEDKLSNQLVSSVLINSESFNVGDCYVQKSAPIVIEYYVLKITLGKKASSYTSKRDEGKYSTVIAELKEMGFTNIRVYRNNDLVNGWITKEGSIDEISIGGNNSFSATDSFYYDTLVEIIVNTFKNSGCEDITEVK